MSDFSGKTVCVVDNGLFVSIAEKLSESFRRVLYWMPWVNGFPKSNQLIVGEGIEGIERIRYLWDHVDEVDLFVFPDVYFGDIQEELVRRGKRVFGARSGDLLELDRAATKALMRQLGLPVAPWKRIVGLDNLRTYLQKHRDVWVKVSATRGDMETWHSVNYDLSEPRIDELEHRLGAVKQVIEFIVEDGIPNATEIGYDGFTVDGRFPTGDVLFGIEAKDVGYVGAVKPYDELPTAVQFVNEKLSPFLSARRYRGFFSTEIRVTDEEVPYLIDPCCRAGSPPSELYQELFSNWPEVMWAAAEGEIVDLEPLARFGVLSMIHSAWADEQWMAVHIDPKVRQWVKLRNHCRIGGKDYIAPQSVKLPEIGAVLGVGDSLKQAIEHCTQNCEGVQGYYLQCRMDGFDAIIQEMDDAEARGISVADADEVRDMHHSIVDGG